MAWKFGPEGTPPRWQQWLAVFVGVIAANNLVIYAGLGRSRLIFDPGERTGYAMGTCLGLALGLTLILWLLFLHRTPRFMTVITFAMIMLFGTLETLAFMPR